MRSASRRRAGSMKCCLACFLLLAGADTFRTRVESLRQSSLAHFTEQTSRHVPSSAGAAFDTQRMNAANSSRRRKNRRAMHRTADGVCLMSVDPGMESDSRIRGDPAALERWLSSGGGILGPVVLEGKCHTFHTSVPTAVEVRHTSRRRLRTALLCSFGRIDGLVHTWNSISHRVGLLSRLSC